MANRILLKKIITMFFCVVIVTSLFGCTKKHNCSYIRMDQFAENWNLAAEESPTGITQGKKTEENEKNYIFSTPGITVFQSGGYHSALEYTAEDLTQVDDIITELFTLFPVNFGDRGASAAIRTYHEISDQYIQPFIEGFRVEFKRVKRVQDVSYTLTVLYGYENGVSVANNVPEGMYGFDLTLDQVVERYNSVVHKNFRNKIYCNGFDIIDPDSFISSEEKFFGGHSVKEVFYPYRNGSKVTLWLDASLKVCGVFVLVPANLYAMDALKTDQVNNRMWLWTNACLGFSSDKTDSRFGGLFNPGETGHTYQSGITYVASKTETGAVFGFIPSSYEFSEKILDWFDFIPLN